MAAQQMHHQLRTIADAQHGDAQLEHLGANGGGILQIYAVGATGKDDAGGLFLPDGLHGLGVGHDLAVNVALTHTAGDQLIVLAAKVHN